MFCDTKLKPIFSPELLACKNLLLAVSGGSDSLALLLLSQAYIARYAPHIELIAVTIDHGLRPESRAEALYVAQICAKRDIKHHISSWQGAKPQGALLAQARKARYLLLLEKLALYPQSSLATGHTLDDQLETYLLRENRNNKAQRGLAAMAQLSYLQSDNVIYPFFRPLLHLRRQELQKFLQQQNIRWLNDPSNDNLRFERIKIRRALNLQKQDKAKELQSQLAIAQNHRQQQALALSSLLEKLKPQFRDNYLCFLYPKLGQASSKQTEQSDELAFLLLLLSAIIGGCDYIASQAKLKLLERFIAKERFNAQDASTKQPSQEQNMRQITLNRSLISRQDQGAYYLFCLSRENRHLSELKLSAQAKAIWDKRFVISNLSGEPLLIRPAKKNEIKELLRHYKNAKQNSPSPPLSKEPIIKAALASMPVIEQAMKSFLALPISYYQANPSAKQNEGLKLYQNSPAFPVTYHFAPYSWLIPGFDIALYQQLRKIFNFNN